jgi:hypothetical protein
MASAVGVQGKCVRSVRAGRGAYDAKGDGTRLAGIASEAGFEIGRAVLEGVERAIGGGKGGEKRTPTFVADDGRVGCGSVACQRYVPLSSLP